MNFQRTSLTLRNQKRLLLSVMQKKVAIKKLEKVTAFGNAKKVAAYNKKWDIKNRKLPLQSKIRFTTCVYSTNKRIWRVVLFLKTLNLSSQNRNFFFTYFFQLLFFPFSFCFCFCFVFCCCFLTIFSFFFSSFLISSH